VWKNDEIGSFCAIAGVVETTDSNASASTGTIHRRASLCRFKSPALDFPTVHPVS
jgi:hypothetical protein